MTDMLGVLHDAKVPFKADKAPRKINAREMPQRGSILGRCSGNRIQRPLSCEHIFLLYTSLSRPHFVRLVLDSGWRMIETVLIFLGGTGRPLVAPPAYLPVPLALDDLHLLLPLLAVVLLVDPDEQVGRSGQGRRGGVLLALRQVLLPQRGLYQRRQGQRGLAGRRAVPAHQSALCAVCIAYGLPYKRRILVT